MKKWVDLLQDVIKRVKLNPAFYQEVNDVSKCVLRADRLLCSS